MAKMKNRKLNSTNISCNLQKQKYLIRKILLASENSTKVKTDKDDMDFTITFASILGIFEFRKLLILCDNYGFNISLRSDKSVLIWHSQTQFEK